MSNLELNNMVYAVLSVRVRNAMWNANFSKLAKKNSVGEMYATPQAFGYALKDQLNRDGENILYKKNIGENGVMDLKEVFEFKIFSIIDNIIKNSNEDLNGKTKLILKALGLEDENSEDVLKALKIKNEKTFNDNIKKIISILKDENKIKAVLFTLFEDIRHFGTTFTAKGYTSFGITGAVQIGQGVNKYLYTDEMVSEMLTCFSAETEKQRKVNEKNQEKIQQLFDKLEDFSLMHEKREKIEVEISEIQERIEAVKSNTLGEQIILDKAHFVYDVTINPYEYIKYKNAIKGFNGYTRDDYESFKKASLKCISNLNSKAKKGCTNEFGLFIETEDEVRDSIDLNCLGEYIEISIEEDKSIIYDLSKVIEILNEVEDRIKSIELYYDLRSMKLIGDFNFIKIFDIRTKKLLKEIDNRKGRNRNGSN